MLWLVCAALVAVILALLLVPLLRPRAQIVGRMEYDLMVYKDQLAEVDREIERGVLNANQADAARTEIQRRILTAAASENTGGAAARNNGTLGAALFVALFVPAMGFGLYGMLGSPSLPDQPYSARAGKIEEMQNQVAMIKSMVASLAAKLEKDPNDGPGWAKLGRSLKVMGETDKAATAYRKAITLMPNDVGARMELASLLLAGVAQGAPLPDEFIAVMKDVLRLEPENVDALYFVGIAEAQAGNKSKARALWTKVVNQLPEGSEDRADVQKQIDALQ